MSRTPEDLRQTIARNIRACRVRMFPGRGGGKRCAEAFGVSPQQWSPWERGMRTPDEMRLRQLADFFQVTVEYLRQAHESDTPGDTTAPDPLADRSRTGTVYVPVFVFMPCLPDSLHPLYDQLRRTLNTCQTGGKP